MTRGGNPFLVRALLSFCFAWWSASHENQWWVQAFAPSSAERRVILTTSRISSESTASAFLHRRLRMTATDPTSSSRSRASRRRDNNDDNNDQSHDRRDDDDDHDDDHDHNNDDIMKDATGHVNRDLAERIWTWEQTSRRERDLPKVEYSVRSGLRLVDAQVRELLRHVRDNHERHPRREQQRSSRNDDDDTDEQDDDDDVNHHSNDGMYADLVQEGLTALLDAMSQYREDHHHHHHRDDDGDDDFEAYASRRIRRHLRTCVRDGARQQSPLLQRRSLPRSVRNVLRRAQGAARRLREEDDGNGRRKNPSVEAVAEALGDVPVRQLQDYLYLARRRRQNAVLSVESTVEVQLPTDDGTSFVDQEDWEISRGLVLDDGRHVHREELVDEFLDETLELEGDDQAWIHREQIAGPLQDSIPDRDEPSPDDTVLTDLIRHDVREFLDATLTYEEQRVVRMVFGLDSGRQASIKETARVLNVPPQRVSLLMAGSLQKLRDSYRGRYVEPYLDLEEEYPVDSV